MFIRIDHLPPTVSKQQIQALLRNNKIIQSIIIKPFDQDAVAWIKLDEDSRVVINHIAEWVSDQYIDGYRLAAQAPLFFNEPWLH